MEFAAHESVSGHLAAAHRSHKNGGSEGFGGLPRYSSSDEEGAQGEDKDNHEIGRRPSPSPFHDILKPLITLAPFVPKMLKDRISSNPGRKYTAFDTASMRDLVSASQTLVPSMDGVQLAIMIADVKGFTALTEILSRNGTRASVGDLSHITLFLFTNTNNFPIDNTINATYQELLA